MAHLQEIDETARMRLEQFMATQPRALNITEQMKVSDPLAWVTQMNSLKAQAEELLLVELIYA